MKKNIKRHIISRESNIKQALSKLDILAKDAILFIVDSNNKLIGSLTDGDVRRGLLKDIDIKSKVTDIIQSNPKFINKSEFDLAKIIELRNKNYKIIPVIDNEGIIIDIINLRLSKSYLPLDVVIVAGGKGTRLKPLTENTPKPLIKVGKKPIIEHNIDRLISYGAQNFWISVNYLGEKIENYFKSGKDKNISIQYIWEDIPMGTIGSVSKINNFKHEDVLVSNSDILTNLDYEKFYLEFKKTKSDLSIVTVPYNVKIPYAVLEIEKKKILRFKEKPTYTYYSNGGIYLIKKSIIDLIPKDIFFNATDLVEKLISLNKIVTSYPLTDYWLDIGKHEDYVKAKEDIKRIKF